MSGTRLRVILCADWSKDARQREVYLADVERREVRRLVGTWTAAAVIEVARRAAGDGAALATFDAPIGVPTSYWQKLRQVPGFPEHAASFAAWLSETAKRPHFFDDARTPRDWGVERPFFAIAAGVGGRRVWEDTLERAGVQPLRRVDGLTGAKPVFVTSGIPGTVGSGARALWQELGALRGTPGAAFAIWPFDGSLEELIDREAVVVGENYPRAAYALALSRENATTRAPMQIAKTRREVRQAALTDLQSRPWLLEQGVRLHDLDAAANSEDAFDALFTAVGLLRCVLEGSPLVPDSLVDPVAEGGILGTGSLDLTRRETTYSLPKAAPPSKPRPSRREALPDMRPRLVGAPRAPQPSAEPVFPCPIPGCDHVFTGSRAGWDAHVSSVRLHPLWEPDVKDPGERKALFREKFRGFFLGRGMAP